MKRKILGLTTLLLFIMFGLTGCNRTENETTSAARLVLEGILGSDLSGNFSPVAFSDVLSDSDSVEEDYGEVSLMPKLLDPFPTDPEVISYYQSVIIKRVKVEYSRKDGLSVEGQHVPYTFTQDVHHLINIDESDSVNFILVQHTAKLESPLLELRYSPEVLKMEAKITIYAQDMGGRWLEPVEGSLSVWFSNFD